MFDGGTCDRIIVATGTTVVFFGRVETVKQHEGAAFLASFDRVFGDDGRRLPERCWLSIARDPNNSKMWAQRLKAGRKEKEKTVVMRCIHGRQHGNYSCFTLLFVHFYPVRTFIIIFICYYIFYYLLFNLSFAMFLMLPCAF